MKNKITVDLLMSTHPCEGWPRERVASLLASPAVNKSSWVAFAESCRLLLDPARPLLADLRLTACRYAAAHHRADVLTPWVQEATRLRVAAQRQRHGAAATPETLAIWTALESWDGSVEQARALFDRAYAERRQYWSAFAAAACDAAAAAYAAYAACDAAAAAAAYAAYAACDAAAAAADDGWQLLLSLCQRLDDITKTIYCPCCKMQVTPDSSNFCGEGEVNHLTDHSECYKCGHCWACEPAAGHYIYKEHRDGEWLTFSICDNVPNVCLERHPDSEEKINIFIEDEDNKHIVTCSECISSVAEIRAQQ